MNYEELYGQLMPLEKKMKDAAAALQKLSKTIAQDTEKGDLKSLAKDLSQFAQILSDQSSIAAQAQETASGFDGRAYYESGDFAAQMLQACAEQGIDVKGEYPVYEMFPYRVRFDTENQDIYLDRKRMQCMRPANFVQTVKAGQERLTKAAFNPIAFAGELSEAYDTALFKYKKHKGTDIYLTNLYKCLVPMSRSRKEYDMQSFAFDLARLYISGADTTKNGRRFQFGTSRESSKAIRILDANGKEQYLATLCFYDVE